MGGARWPAASSSRPLAVGAAATVAFVLALLAAIVAPSLWRTVLWSAGWLELEDGNGLMQTIGMEEVKAVRESWRRSNRDNCPRPDECMH
jgi:hypothetical protein